MLANWLVCLAVYQATMARDVVSKIAAIWWPIFIFVLLGMNHVIANMFSIPLGIYYGAPFGVGYYIWKSMSELNLPVRSRHSLSNDSSPGMSRQHRGWRWICGRFVLVG